MNVGDRFRMRRQEFECVRVTTDTTAARTVRHLSLRSTCSSCGSGFVFIMVASDVPKRLIQCKCDPCRTPPATGTRARARRLTYWRARAKATPPAAEASSVPGKSAGGGRKPVVETRAHSAKDIQP